MKKLIDAGHLLRVSEIKQDNFISSTVITVKKDKTVKLAMDARILNDNTIKRKAQMLNLEKSLGQVSLSITKKNLKMPDIKQVETNQNSCDRMRNGSDIRSQKMGKNAYEI